MLTGLLFPLMLFLRIMESNDFDRCKCGWKNPTKIVGGKKTRINEYPMMAGIVDSINKIISCGAIIINDRQVLTAAHCLMSFKDPKTMGVLVGAHDLRKRGETKSIKLFRIRDYKIHPNYYSETKDDIGIVTIDGLIKFSQRVGPVCLPFQHAQDTFAGSHVDILGWGSTYFSSKQSDTLRKAEVTVLSTKKCRKKWPNIGEREICTLEPEKDACQFDSGGPLLWRNPATKRIVLLGIVAYGSACADGIPAVNTRVGFYIDWILSESPTDFKYCDDE